MTPIDRSTRDARHDGPLSLVRSMERRVRAFVRSHGRKRIELVPSDGVVFGVVGTPGRNLEIYWLSPAGQFRLLDAVRARRLSPHAADDLARRLSWAHASHAAAPRHVVSIARREVPVVVSDGYGGELRRVVVETVGG